MQWAYDENINRIKASYSGQKATCPLCNSILIGKCGEIYTWHWQHSNKSNCDSWKEHETAWHRNWKNKFPLDWQEKLIKQNDEIHIADVYTDKDIVIEFQNSSVSKNTIREREAFYQNMVWVVNASSFKQNFILRSLVSSGLRHLESDSAQELKNYRSTFEEDFSTITKEISQTKNSSAIIFNDVRYKTDLICRYKEKLESATSISSEIQSTWVSGNHHWDLDLVRIRGIIEDEFQKIYKENLAKIKAMQSERGAIINNLNKISELKDYLLQGITYKIVDCTQINPKNFQNVRALLKTSLNTLFPKIVSFKNETEYKDIQYRSKEYLFLYNPKDTIEYFENKLGEIEKEEINTKVVLAVIDGEITIRISELIKNEIEKTDLEIIQLNAKWESLIQLENSLTIKKEKSILYKDKNIAEMEREINSKKKTERFKVMREKKGKYTFEWKHERKSWEAAKCPIFFDTKEGFLFQKLKDGLLKKILIPDFLIMMSSNKAILV